MTPYRLRRARLAVTLLLAASTTSAARAGAPPPPAPVDWAGTELVVSARPGPVFWRVTRGSGEVWILGTPTVFLQRQRWDTSRLQRLLAGSRLLLMRAGFEVTGAVRLRSHTGEVEAGLPPELRARMRAAVLAAGLPLTRYRDLTSLETAFHLQADLEAADGIGSEQPERRVRELAQRAHVPITAVAVYPVPWAEVEGAEASLIPCVDGALADAAFAHLHTARASRAWALGDLQTVRADSAAPTLEACMTRLPTYGALAARAEADTTATLLAALDGGGRVVAVQSLDSLLKPDGVLARLRAAGAEVTAPEAAQVEPVAAPPR